MADDHYSRPIRPPHFPARPHAPQHGPASGGDPLAELARLIGQSADPYRGHPQDDGRQDANGAYDAHAAQDYGAQQWSGADPRFPQHDPYAPRDPYAQDDTYARQEAYPQQEPYAPRDPHPQHDPYARDAYPDSAYTAEQGYDDPYRDLYRDDAAPRAPYANDRLYSAAPGYPEPHGDAPGGEARYGGAQYAEPHYAPAPYETPQFASPDYDNKPYPPYDNQYYAQPSAFPAVPHPDHAAAGQMHAANGHGYAPYADAAYPDAAYADPNAAYGDAPYYHPQPAESADAPTRRRGGLVTVFAVLALAVVGTAGAFAYRSMFAPSGANIAPPVIKADTAPSKIVPAASDSAKPIQDRVGDRAQLERLITREEQPVEVNTARAGAPRVIFPGPNPIAPLPDSPIPPSPNAAAPAAVATGSAPAANEPKKIRTVTIRSDQPDVAPVAAPAQNASGGAPLSLSPGGAQPAPQRTAPVRNAAVPAAAVAGGYSVQVTSQRSEGEAQAAFAALQAKFPGVLGGRQAVIRRADLGDKGVYYRAQVPFGSQGEAADFCASLKSAGGQCVIQRN